MAIGSKVSGEFKSASGLFAKVNGGWKKAQFGYVKVAGEWKQFWADKLEDAFDRADTINTLGTATSGQAWTILRSQWRINSNNANTTGAKTDLPLASIDVGFLDFELEANELTPGTGVAIRVQDANNWWGVVPFYNQTSQTFTYCVQSRTVSYCIANCPEVAGYTLRCDPPNTYTSEPIYEIGCPAGYEIRYFEDFGVIGQDCPPSYYERQCYDEVSQVETCRYRERWDDYVCTTRDVTTRVCDNVEVFPDCTDIYGPFENYEEICPGGEGLVYVGQENSCLPDGFTNVPQYTCCQFGQYDECIQTATGTTYTNFYYLQVVKMVNGVFSVVADVQVPERWSAVKISADAGRMTVKAYSDSLYTREVGTYTTPTFLSTGTGYGVLSRASNFEDGRTIGSIKVKALGQ